MWQHPTWVEHVTIRNMMTKPVPDNVILFMAQCNIYTQLLFSYLSTLYIPTQVLSASLGINFLREFGSLHKCNTRTSFLTPSYCKTFRIENLVLIPISIPQQVFIKLVWFQFHYTLNLKILYITCIRINNHLWWATFEDENTAIRDQG